MCMCVRVRLHALLNCQYQDACIEITAMGFTYTVHGACKSHPCRNGGSCTISANGYKCACKVNYLGRNCQREF